MSTKRVSEMTDDEIRELASAPRPTTYWQAQSGYRSLTDARERYDELSTRELMDRSYATLKANGTYDPRKHGDASKYQPLTTAEHLEVLAVGEMLARYFRHPADIDHAVQAGASWSQVAEAVGSDEAHVRQAYRQWADGQHRLHADYDGKFGMNNAEHAAAIRRAAEPPARPGTEHEAGQ